MKKSIFFFACFMAAQISFGQKVGIGTTSPSYPLHVMTGDGFGIMQQNGGIFLGTYTSSSSGGSTYFGTFSSHPLNLCSDGPNSQLVLIPSGNVGIGLDNPLQKLHVAGNLAVDNNVGIGNTDPHAPLQLNNALQNRKIVLYEAANNDHQYFGFGINPGQLRYQSSGDHAFFFGANSTTSNELMRIKSNGSVGIGITNPQATLEITRGTAPYGTLEVDGTNYNSHFNYGTPEDTYIRGGKPGAKVLINDYGNPGNVGIGTANPLQKLQVGGNLAVEDSVGIGITNPHAPLQFSQAEQNRKIVLYENFNNDHQFFGFGVNSFTLRYQVPATNFNHIFYAGASANTSNELMRITGEGRVGIGVTSPGAMLEITRGTAPNGSLQIDGTTYASHFNFGSMEDTYIRGGKDGGKVIINDYGTLGNVGIGTASPAEKLDVTGNVNVSGNLKLGYIRVASAVISIPAFSYGTQVCNCPAGTVVIGGGVQVFSYVSKITKSYPNTDSTWQVEMYNDDIGPHSLQAWAICARLAN